MSRWRNWKTPKVQLTCVAQTLLHFHGKQTFRISRMHTVDSSQDPISESMAVRFWQCRFCMVTVKSDTSSVQRFLCLKACKSEHSSSMHPPQDLRPQSLVCSVVATPHSQVCLKHPLSLGWGITMTKLMHPESCSDV